MVTTTRDIRGLNAETQNVMNYMAGVRTKKQIVGEFFGLREEAVYDDNGENVIDFINDFKDIRQLESKGVHYHPRLADLGVSEQDFNGLFYGEIPSYTKKKEAVKKVEENIAPKVTETQDVIDNTQEDIEALREDYKAKFGKYPAQNIKLETLKARLGL